MNRKFIFAVQGEGRGHLTQAIAAYELLTAHGHEVVAVLIGSSQRREIPAFVKERIKVPVLTYPSPNFYTDKEHKSIRLGKTILENLRRLKSFRKGIQLIRSTIDELQADVLINFYEPLIGISSFFQKLPVKIVSIAHQYIYLHPEFQFPANSPAKEKWILKNYSALTGKGSDALLALSFYPMQQNRLGSLTVMPPLLRKEVFEQDVFNGRHLLVYLLNAGYKNDIIEWHRQHPEQEIHCFTDCPSVKGRYDYDETLFFHSLDDKKFLRFMANAKALVTTAGFESVSEALYFGKPVLMVPVQGHFEQWCNARDGAKAGAGIYADKFELNAIAAFLPFYQNTAASFRKWSQEAPEILLETIAGVLHEPYNEKMPEQCPAHFQLSSLLPQQQVHHS
jgi:uncharacterized protein (TIGR00661 family)